MGRGGVSPTHFFYDMTFGEAAAYLRGMEKRDRQAWEQTRMIVCSMGGKLKFPWDNEKTEQSKEVEQKELERIRELAKTIKL